MTGIALSSRVPLNDITAVSSRLSQITVPLFSFFIKNVCVRVRQEKKDKVLQTLKSI